MVGYLSFLKVGPKLLKFLPGKLARAGGPAPSPGPGRHNRHEPSLPPLPS